MKKTHFGLTVYDKILVKEDDIKKLPFFDFWNESVKENTYKKIGDEYYVLLSVWESFCRVFMKTGKHRFSDSYENKNEAIDINDIRNYAIKIVMDEEKILKENRYKLEDIYKAIDELAEFAGMKKLDKYYYVSQNDTPSDLGCFVYSNLEDKDWFMDNVKEWLWLDKDEGVEDIFKIIKEFKEKNK